MATRASSDSNPDYNPPVRLVSSAPTRIDLAGGTIDIWPLYLSHEGASTVNAAISLRAHVEIESRDDGRIELRSVDTDRALVADRWSELSGSGDLSLLSLLARHYKVENLTLVPSNLDLAGAEVELSSIPGREFVLREALAVARHKYDAILIDCPPNIGILTVNAIVACDLMIVPVQSEFLSMDGLPTLLKFMRIVKSRAKTDFDYRILLTLFDKRTGLSKKVVQQLRTSFGDHILKIVIPRSIRMAEAPSKGIPGIIYSPRNSASEEYRRLTKELLEGSLADTVLTKLGSTAD